MTIRIYLTIFFATLFQFCAQAQMGKDPVLFTVNGDEVRVSEFQYIYEKTNGDEANYSIRSVNEYLDLYKKFKLKVAHLRIEKFILASYSINFKCDFF